MTKTSLFGRCRHLRHPSSFRGPTTSFHVARDSLTTFHRNWQTSIGFALHARLLVRGRPINLICQPFPVFAKRAISDRRTARLFPWWFGAARRNLTNSRTETFSQPLAYSYLDPLFPSQSPTQKTRDALDTFTPPVGSALGSPNSYTYPFEAYRKPGIPYHSFSGRLNYQFDNGLGASLGVVVTSPVPLDYGEHVTIPTQYQLDAGHFLRATEL